MSDFAVNNIVRKLNTEFARRLVTHYFINKGFNESLDMKVYPPSLQDFVERIPQLEDKVEIVPSADEVDPRNGYAKIRWDMFVLGNNRLFLGFSEHQDLQSLARQIGCQGPIVSEARQSSYETTPMNVITFICRVLENSRSGMIRGVENPRPGSLKIPNVGATFFRHGSPARFEHK